MLDESFGIIALRVQEGNTEVLLIKHIDRYGGHWAFPKGHKIDGETDSQAAIREFKEETGLDSLTIAPAITFSESYRYVRGNQRINKKVVYYLGWIDNDAPFLLQHSEVQNAVWIVLDEAVHKVTYEGAKQVLYDVIAYLQ